MDHRTSHHTAHGRPTTPHLDRPRGYPVPDNQIPDLPTTAPAPDRSGFLLPQIPYLIGVALVCWVIFGALM